MKSTDPQPIQKSQESYRVERPTQTGFSSPATHYNEPRIDLNTILAPNAEATFYVRMVDDSAVKFGIEKNDVLIVDKSLTPKLNQLLMVNSEGNFQIIRMETDYSAEISLWGVITYIIKNIL
ncbi:peptidase S24 [Chryseobacterium sp. Ch-15]|uniref:Peptidase S24 n=1 Tax=Chryseobacterium muglaense TaxID=2893752 RepID=A0A9Q3UXH2_9FLAO|nr:S24 family peptidase [Chryseobacterium muglaense]MBD3903333.1 peptidase S24 [Chryseobacterium muglaense]MCC9036162.1 peptidase S24 [Chryseobacterium muglaense]MCM2553263.1 peptidase S24 [Chryseobacterium muglaense]